MLTYFYKLFQIDIGYFRKLFIFEYICMTLEYMFHFQKLFIIGYTRVIYTNLILETIQD